MAIDLRSIKDRLNSLKNTTTKTAEFWKPKPGKYQVRIVPYTHNKDNPFIELYFHYGINNKTYLSPISFGRPDPIVEFSDKLKRMGTKDEWKAGKRMEPKLRTYVPVLIRGEEGEGVRFWGFGKTVYQELLGYIADPDYGDITDPITGRDIVVEITSAEESGTSYPVTTIRIKPKETPLSESAEKLETYLTSQTNIADLYEELSYSELNNILEGWLNPSNNSTPIEEPAKNTKSTVNDDDDDVFDNGKKQSNDSYTPQTLSKTKVNEIEDAFDDLFGD